MSNMMQSQIISAMLTFGVLLWSDQVSHAADRSALYRSLTLIEEPLAFELGDVTFSLRGTLEASSHFQLSNDQEPDAEFATAIEASAEAQLLNYWDLKGSYILGFDTQKAESFDHRGILSLRGPNGTLSIGHVSDALRHQTDRNLSVGNAELAYNDALAELNELSVAHIYRQGPVQLGGVADFKGNFEVGGVFQRPIANKDLRFSLRATKGTFQGSTDISKGSAGTIFDVAGAHGMAEMVYSNWTLNLGTGYEYLTSGSIKAQRIYLSSGIARKIGAISLSAEAHYGQIAGSDVISAAAGASYDFARGASVNAGLNYQKAQADKDGVAILDDDETELILSLRYSF